MAKATPVSLERPNVSHDVDAAHARLRSHQASLDYINSRVEGNERRLDRLEKRIDDQSYVLSELSATANATQKEVHSQSGMLTRAVERVDYMVSRLDEHTSEEIDAQNKQTKRIERLHRTMIRAASVLAIIAIVLVAITRDSQPQWLEALIKIMWG